MSEELKIPEQHAYETGNVVTPARPGDGVEITMVAGGVPTVITGAVHFSAAHNSAAMLHGWGKKDENWGHRHHAGEPIKLSRADYLTALEAAGKTDEFGEYVPHPGAASEHCEAREHHKSHAERAARHRATQQPKGERRNPRVAADMTEAAKV